MSKERFAIVDEGLSIDFKTNRGWAEFAGAGTLTEEILREAGSDVKQVKGFGFGFGLERIAMFRLKLDDIRKLWQPPYV